MKFDINCSNCGKSFRVDEQAMGRKARCASCGTVFVVTSNADAPDDGREEFERWADQPDETERQQAMTPATATPRTGSSLVTTPAMIERNSPLNAKLLLCLAAVFGVSFGAGGVVAWNVIRPRTFFEELEMRNKAARGQPEQAEVEAAVKEFRGKKIPPGQAMVLGFLDETASVIAYEDEESFLAQELDGTGRAAALRKGVIVELQPKLLVRSVKIIEGHNGQLTRTGTYALQYEYKGEDVDRNKLHEVEILEGPLKGQHWLVHEISLVRWDNVEEQTRHRDNTRRKPGDLRFAVFVNVQGDRFVHQTDPISVTAGF